MKNRWLAFFLNDVIPGAGLAYLGKWKWAVADLLATVALGFFFAHFGGELFRIFVPAAGAINGVIAMNVAETMNDKLSVRSMTAAARR